MKCLKVGMLKEGKAACWWSWALGWGWGKGLSRELQKRSEKPRNDGGPRRYPESGGRILLLYASTPCPLVAHCLTSSGRDKVGDSWCAAKPTRCAWQLWFLSALQLVEGKRWRAAKRLLSLSSCFLLTTRFTETSLPILIEVKLTKELCLFKVYDLCLLWEHTHTYVLWNNRHHQAY